MNVTYILLFQTLSTAVSMTQYGNKGKQVFCTAAALCEGTHSHYHREEGMLLHIRSCIFFRVINFANTKQCLVGRRRQRHIFALLAFSPSHFEN
jgi:hypothetical protein